MACRCHANQFERDVAAVASLAGPGRFMVNLCEDRYCFLAAFAAAQSLGHTVLLPSSRAEQVITEVEVANAGSYRCDDAMVTAAQTRPAARPVSDSVAADHICMIGFTSGTTGQPQSFPKRWGSMMASTTRNAEAIRAALNLSAAAPLALVATVPPQHIYGMEFSILLPLSGGVGMHVGTTAVSRRHCPRAGGNTRAANSRQYTGALAHHRRIIAAAAAHCADRFCDGAAGCASWRERWNAARWPVARDVWFDRNVRVCASLSGARDRVAALRGSAAYSQPLTARW